MPVKYMTARLAIFLIRGYQLLLSPIVGGGCRFVPSCSAYAVEAIQTHGAARGLWLAARRIGRCHPLGGHGYDAVPEAGHVFSRGAARERKCDGRASGAEFRL
ncbi:MAG TPA: membrane protein insertion efficiency factor YidD [Vicinamibacterales bacterium]|jgi:putative membrane protein insertion efficiency factor|nr:membrane protein insertion efficiency factor YidD [Vicinamibacterales bacterium]